MRHLCCFIPIILSAALVLPAAAVFAESELSLLPYPAEVTLQADRFLLNSNFNIALPDEHPLLTAAASLFMQRLSQQTSIDFNPEARPSLLLQLTEQQPAEAAPQADMVEHYQLTVSNNEIRLTAASTIGLLRGLETLLQLVQTDTSGSSIVALNIVDQPRFSWRGLLLDPARRFLPIATLQRQLDMMAAVKLNVLHLHLTDDQGWRFESLRYPKLQQVAGTDGYYTQQQLRELVQYAAQRGIRIVPEIDLPGHTTALGAAYPELMAMPGPGRPETHWGVHQAVLDPSNEQVYHFLANLLAEVAAVFPDRYLHIGGDEVLPDHWLGAPHIVDFMQQQQLADVPALQAYFNTRLQQILQRLGRTMIGWDEVLDGELPKSVLVQSWRGTESLANAAKAGHQAILSTGYYLDQPQFASYHYRNDPIPAAAPLPELSNINSWSAWQFEFARKRGSAISGKLMLLSLKDGSSSAILQFKGRQPQLLSQFKLNANQLSFSVDSWMGPLQARFNLAANAVDNQQHAGSLNGSLIVGNAAYSVSGSAIALEQASTALPMQLQPQRINSASKARILGGEIALWGELVTPDNIDIRLWPHGFAVAERLWSAATLLDEQSMYRRMQLLFAKANAQRLLHTDMQQQLGLVALAGQQHLTSLATLSQTLEPAHYYHRLHEKSVAGLYHANAPLNQLVDYLPAEHPAMRRFSADIELWLSDKSPAAFARLSSQLGQWQQAAVSLADIDQPELSLLAKQIAQLSRSASMLLDSIRQQQPLTASERTAISRQLDQATAIQQEMIIALHRPLQQLLVFAPHSEVWVAAGTFSAAAEGPAVDSAGNLYAVNFAVDDTIYDGNIGKVTPDGKASLYLNLPQGSIGNGIVFDRAGAMYIADYTGHNILKYQHGKLEVHAHNSAMHQPNDLAIMDNGVLFASDPNWSDNSGQLWRIDQHGSSHLVGMPLTGSMGTTNGIAVSPDQQYLYVNESVQRQIWRFEINADHSLGAKQRVARFSDYGLDGMRFDRSGNLYVARYGKGTVVKLSASGELLAEYRLNHPLPTNVSLNNADSELYITIQQCGCIEKIALEH